MRYSRYRKIILLFGDLLIINLSFISVASFRYGFNSLISNQGLLLLSIINVSWIALVLITSPYRFSRTTRFAKILRGHYTLFILNFMLSSVILLFQEYYNYENDLLFYGHSLFAILLFIWRVAFVYSLRIYRSRGFNFRNIIILGHGDLSIELKNFFRQHPEFGYKYLGTFDNNSSLQNIRGSIGESLNFAKENQIDEIYCCLPYVDYPQIRKIIQYGEDNLVKIKLISEFRGFSYKGLQLERYDHIPVLNVTATPLDDRKNYIVKRSFDITFSLSVILLIFTWLFPFLALAVKLTSNGPIFFKQKRTGKDNKAFWCYKFRTMHVNNDADKKQATKGDNRITSIGNFMRKTSLDELPQFFNVLIGNMSVVGPRPHMLSHTEEYSRRIEKFMVRHFVKPGITGLAQAKGYRGETKTIIEMKNRVKLDRFYIENWSMVLDVKIILLTIYTLVKGDHNAY